MAPRILIFSIVMGGDYSFYVKSIPTFALAFSGYITSVLASVKDKVTYTIWVSRILKIFFFQFHAAAVYEIIFSFDFSTFQGPFVNSKYFDKDLLKVRIVLQK